jgi:hypothetical protein
MDGPPGPAPYHVHQQLSCRCTPRSTPSRNHCRKCGCPQHCNEWQRCCCRFFQCQCQSNRRQQSSAGSCPLPGRSCIPACQTNTSPQSSDAPSDIHLPVLGSLQPGAVQVLTQLPQLHLTEPIMPSLHLVTLPWPILLPLSGSLQELGGVHVPSQLPALHLRDKSDPSLQLTLDPWGIQLPVSTSLQELETVQVPSQLPALHLRDRSDRSLQLVFAPWGIQLPVWGSCPCRS